jgi:hypothetical protein
MIMRRIVAYFSLVFGLVAGVALTCSQLPASLDRSTRPYAFVADSLPAAPSLNDTGALSTADTIHFRDSVAFIGIVYPEDSRVKGFYWDFGDGTRDTHALVKHCYASSGVYRGAFFIYDNDGFTIADTVVVCVNTPPDSVRLLSPASDSVDELLTPELSWKAFDRDAYDSTFIYLVLVSRADGFIDTAVKWTRATSLLLDRNFKKCENLSWLVIAKDKFGDSAVSAMGKFIMKPSSDATLTSLFLPLGNLTPPFSPNDTVYCDTVPNETDSIDLDFSSRSKHAAVTVNDEAVPEGVTRVKLPLPITINIFIIRIISSDNSTTKTYSLTIVRRPRTNALLSSLRVTIGTKNVSFSETVFDYSDTVPWTIQSIDISPKAQDPAATIAIKGSPVRSGDSSVSVSIEVGPNEIPIEVTAQDGKTKKNYTLSVLRRSAANASLASLNLSAGTLKNVSGIFPDTLRDTVSFLDSVITVRPAAVDTHAAIFIDSAAVRSGASSSISVKVGINAIPIKITLPSGAESKTYVLLIVRKPDGSVSPTAAPASASASGVSVSSVRISWGDVPEATFYSLQRSLQAADGFSTIGLPTSTSFIDTGLPPGSVFYYRVCASNSKGNGAFSVVDSAMTFRKPFFTSHPRSQTATVGNRAIFSVIAGGIPLPTYQWQRNKVDIAFAETAACTTGALAVADQGARYRCIIRNDAGADTSTEATLTVESGSPDQPQDVSVVVGESISLIINASEAITAIQWRKDGVDLPEAKSCTLSINGVLTAHAGLYSVKVGGGSDTATSKTFRLRVLPQPPTGVSAQPRSAQSMGITWNQTPGASWYRVLRASGGATVFASICSTSQTTVVDTPLTEGTTYLYKVCAGNPDGMSDTTVPTGASTLCGPRILTPPESQIIGVGQTIELSVSAAGVPACSYQWEKDGVAMSGATSERYTRSNATVADSGDYRVVLVNSVGTLTSTIAHVSVRVTPPSYTLLTNAATPGGTVTRTKVADSYVAGDTVSLIAHVVAGYRFAGWSGDTAGSVKSDSSVRITMNKNKEVVAQFIRRLTLTVLSGGGGTASLVGDSACDSGQVVRVTAAPSATPGAGYRFNGWGGDTAGAIKNGNVIDITVNTNKIVNAKFFRRQRLTVSVGAGGSATLAGDSTCDSGQVVRVTAVPGATPVPGYRFNGWGGDTAAATKNGAVIDIVMNKDKAVTAKFFRRQRLNVSIGLGSGTTTFLGDSVCDSGATIRVTATPSLSPTPGYRFSSWGGDTAGATKTVNNIDVVMNKNKILNAQFLRRCRLTISIGLGLGTTTFLGDSICDSGATLQVTATPSATPAPGYRFDSWSGDTSGAAKNANIVTVTMASNRAIGANFWRQYNLTLSAAFPNGSMTPPPGTYAVDSAAVTAISATPNSGYGFIAWLTRIGAPIIADPNARSTTVQLHQNDATLVPSFTTTQTFNRTFGGSGDDRGNCVWQTSDGGFIIAGMTMSSGAGYEDVYLIRTDAAGQEIKSVTFGAASTDYALSVQETADKGFVVVGSQFSANTGEDVWLIKTDSDLKQQWTKTFGYSSIDFGRCVRQAGDGGYLITGHTILPGTQNSDMYVIKTDPSGNTNTGQEYWAKSFGGTGSDEGGYVIQNKDGDLIVVGKISVSSLDDDISLTKLNKYGNPIWAKQYGGNNREYGNCVRQTADGGYVISGKTASFGNGGDDVYVIKTDAAGDTTWTRTFGGIYLDEGNSIQQTTDGGYIIAGTSVVSGKSGELYLLKLDGNGNKAWEKTFGGIYDDYGYSVQQTADGGYLVTGAFLNKGNGYDAILIKTDDKGNVY